MKKNKMRLIAILLTLVLLMGTLISFAETLEEKYGENPVVTIEFDTAENPESTEEPAETDAPDTTEEPVGTENPDTTEMPESTEAPESGEGLATFPIDNSTVLQDGEYVPAD